jgi:hypothetical protein
MGAEPAGSETRPEVTTIDTDGELQVVDRPAIATRSDDTIRCAACDNEVTMAALAISPAGRHQHTFRNPAGYSWTVVCFRDAPGCRAEGGFTAEATWFPGYAWCFGRCGRCGRHLGWWYVADGSSDPDGTRSFIGLIATRLKQAPG